MKLINHCQYNLTSTFFNTAHHSNLARSSSSG